MPKKQVKKQLNKEAKKINVWAYVVVAIAVFVITFIIGANLIIISNDCDSPCRWVSKDKVTACPTVCVKSQQTLWEKITGQEPHFIGY